MWVSEQQRVFFETFGFFVSKGHLAQGEVERLSAEFDEAMQGVEAPEGRNRSRILLSGDTPFLTSMAEEERFFRVAEELLQRDTICVQVAGYRFVGDTPWHTDNRDLAYDGVKLVVYLDPLDAESGALRVLPGSHRNPLWQKSPLSADTRKVFGTRPDAMPAHVIPTRPGDIIAFRHSIWHASFHGSDSRRMVEYNFYCDPEDAKEERAFRLQMHRNHSPSARLGRQLYPASWRNCSPEAGPRHRWISRLEEIGVLETPDSP